MSKKLRIRAIGAIILSAMLFMLPIGALFANNTMTAPVLAADESASQNESEATSGNTDEDVSGNEEESTSENEATEGEESGEGEEVTEPVKLVCTCTEHCSGKYSYNTNCEACSDDYTKCEYVNPNVAITITPPAGWSNDRAKVLPGDRSDREMVQDQCGHRLSFKLTPATEYFFIVSDIRSSRMSLYQWQ